MQSADCFAQCPWKLNMAMCQRDISEGVLRQLLEAFLKRQLACFLCPFFAPFTFVLVGMQT